MSIATGGCPTSVRADPLLYGECLGGALYWNDFLPMAKQAGFLDPRLVTSRPIDVENEAMRAKLGQAKFFSATYRLFKLDGLEPACEDYGQAVIYKGTIAEQPDAFALDGHHLIERGKVFTVCGNTWRMLADTRFHAAFRFHRRFRHALRHLPRLRHVDPVRHERRGAGANRAAAVADGDAGGGGQCNSI